MRIKQKKEQSRPRKIKPKTTEKKQHTECCFSESQNKENLVD